MRARPRARRVAVVTGSRAEYGLLKSVLRAISVEPRLELRVVAAGMHLLPAFGSTVREIERDGYRVAARVRMQRGDDSPNDQALGLARGVASLARYFERCEPDIVLILGDRVEALAAALAATTTGRLIAHIHGGDVARGDFDEAIRHAITKLAHLHFTATRAAQRRVLRMGEASRDVHFVGAPGLDGLRERIDAGIAPKPPARAIILQHPTGRAAKVEQNAMCAILHAAASERLDATLIYPNSDRGHSGIVRAIERIGRRSGFRVCRSMPRDCFLEELLLSRVIVGNSSCGAIEAGFAGAAFVCVGDRQVDRESQSGSVFPARETVPAIRRAIRAALSKRLRPAARTPWGDGHAGERIAALLATLPLSAERRRKRICY